MRCSECGNSYKPKPILCWICHESIIEKGKICTGTYWAVKFVSRGVSQYVHKRCWNNLSYFVRCKKARIKHLGIKRKGEI